MNSLEPISHAYLRSDLRQIVHALALVGTRGKTEYAQGFGDALAAVAIALGIEPPLPPHIITIEQPAQFER